MKKIYIKINCKGEKNSRESKQRNKCRKNNNRLKKLKLKIKKREKKENSINVQKPNIEVYNNKKCDWEKKNSRA